MFFTVVNNEKLCDNDCVFGATGTPMENTKGDEIMNFSTYIEIAVAIIAAYAAAVVAALLVIRRCEEGTEDEAAKAAEAARAAFRKFFRFAN